MLLILILAAVGAAAGWTASRVLRPAPPLTQCVAIGAVGGLAGGLLIRFLLPLLFSVIGAAAGAALLILLVQRWRGR